MLFHALNTINRSIKQTVCSFFFLNVPHFDLLFSQYAWATVCVRHIYAHTINEQFYFHYCLLLKCIIITIIWFVFIFVVVVFHFQSKCHKNAFVLFYAKCMCVQAVQQFWIKCKWICCQNGKSTYNQTHNGAQSVVETEMEHRFEADPHFGQIDRNTPKCIVDNWKIDIITSHSFILARTNTIKTMTQGKYWWKLLTFFLRLISLFAK